MPATGPDRTRRALLLGAAAALLHAADPAAEAWEVVTGLAAALGRASEVAFLAYCDRQMPAYESLRANVSALVAAMDVESAIDPVRNDGDDRSRELEVDWQMRMVGRSGLRTVAQRQDTVKCRLERRGRGWKVVRLEPVAFFAPPSA
jgi:hypothetical protein